MKITYQVGKIEEKIEKICEKEMKKTGFSKIYSKSILALKARMSLNMISLMQAQKTQQKKQGAIKSFKRFTQKMKSSKKIYSFLLNKLLSNERVLYQVMKDGLNRQVMLNRFKKGMVVKKILDKQDMKAVAKMF